MTVMDPGIRPAIAFFQPSRTDPKPTEVNEN